MWVTNIRIRALCKFCLGIDLPIYGFDQKGIYMNEAGSKNVGALTLDSDVEVPLKENHAATRTRVSLMTCVVSSEGELNAYGNGLPLEILFRGLSERALRDLEIPDSSNVSKAQTTGLGNLRDACVNPVSGRLTSFLTDVVTSERARLAGWRWEDSSNMCTRVLMIRVM